jgi:2-dehydropantoate 2-reductase
MSLPTNPKIVFLGIGAIGGTAAAWVSKQHAETYLLARGRTAEAIEAAGLTLYSSTAPERKERIPVRAIRGLDEVPDADVVVIATKVYQLDAAAQQVQAALGDRALVVGLQNGVAGEDILPRYFSRVVYGIVCYNAWVDAPGVIGYQTNGPLLLATPDNGLQDEMRTLAGTFNPGLRTQITDRLTDAAHCKLVVNLGNSVTTLMGLNYRPIDDLDLFQKILAETAYEGVRVIRAAGYREVKLGDIPSWAIITASARLPMVLTRGTFRRSIGQLTMSSMGQDVLQRKKTATELEVLNGYLLSLAERCRVPAPYNRAIYRLCKERFAQPNFEPLSPWEVWEAIREELSSLTAERSGRPGSPSGG